MLISTNNGITEWTFLIHVKTQKTPLSAFHCNIHPTPAIPQELFVLKTLQSGLASQPE